MKCSEIEELMPGYLEGSLSESSRRDVEAHIASCEACRESLAIFASLERSLEGLKTAMPSWKTAEARFMREAGLSRRRSALRVLCAPPVVAGLSLAVIGFVAIRMGGVFFNGLEGLLSRFALSLGDLGRAGSESLAAFANTDLVTIVTVYDVTLVAIIAGTGALALKYVRR